MISRRLIRLMVLSGAVSAQGAQAANLASESVGLGSGTYGSTGLTTRAPTQETGVKLSDDSILHVGLGAEAGYDTNVFYAKQNPVSAPVIRVTPFAEITNATRSGTVPSGLYYDLNASLQYREYLSSDEATKAQRAFNPTVTGIAEFGNGQKLGFMLTDQFVRSEEPPYGAPDSASQAEQSTITRNNNTASAQIRAVPGGGRLQAVLRYTNSLDLFSNEAYKFANSMGNEIMFDGSWRWLPKTAIFLQASQGAITYLNKPAAGTMVPAELRKADSFPFRVVGGLRGLVTEKLAANLSAGYVAGFYQGSAQNPSGLSNLATVAEATYKITTLTEVMLGFRHEFRNSVIGDYYDVNSPYAAARHKLAGRFNIFADVRYEIRKYGGYRVQGMPLDRTDNFLHAGLQADYQVQKWFYAGVGYQLMQNRTNVASTGPGGGFDYIKHQVFARLGFTY